MQQLRCHHCGSLKLVLRETHYEYAEYSGLFLTPDGEITAAGEGLFKSGDILPERTEVECGECGHFWHPRRRFRGTLTPASPVPGNTEGE